MSLTTAARAALGSMTLGKGWLRMRTVERDDTLPEWASFHHDCCSTGCARSTPMLFSSDAKHGWHSAAAALSQQRI